jgi:Transposase IS116/IS110/IS902 family
MFSKLFQSSAIIHDADARLLVNLYYDHQSNRQRIENRTATAERKGETNLSILEDQKKTFEKQEKEYRKALTKYVDEHITGDWFKGVYGVSPILAAGLLSAIDITKASTVGHIWSYCGLDPNRSNTFDKSKDQPMFNQHLKRITWLIGYSFRQFSSNSNCLYGKLYLERKQFETQKNQNLEYSETAKRYLDYGKYRDEAAKLCLEQGMLTAPHIDARARRWTVKIFISHLHRVWYEKHYGEVPPMAFTNDKLNYQNFISVHIPKDHTNTLDNVSHEHEDDI